jgi:hypothetical protein
MPEPPPETLAWLRHAASCGQRDAQLTLHILERLEALEAKYETQRLATLEWGKDVDKLMRWSDKHLKRIMALEQRPIPGTVELAAPTPEATPVATDEDLWDFWCQEGMNFIPEVLRACYNLGRQHGAAQPPAAQPTPEPAAPAGGLVERVDRAIVRAWADCGPKGEACAAIREVAAWIRLELNGRSVADRLELEADR